MRTMEGASEVDASWVTLVDGMRVLQESLDRTLQASNHITQSYLEILKALSEADGHSLRMSDLATVTRSSRSRLSHAVGRLQERGYIKRVGYEADRRGQVARLTITGLDLVTQAVPAHAEAVRSQLLDRLTPLQLATLGEVGTIMMAATDGQPDYERRAAPDHAELQAVRTGRRRLSAAG